MDCLAGLFGPKKGIVWLGYYGLKNGLVGWALMAQNWDWMTGLLGPNKGIGWLVFQGPKD